MKTINKITLMFAFVALLGSNTSYNLEPIKEVEESKATVKKAKNDKELVIFNWEDYIDEDLIAEFEEEYGCTVKYYTFDTNETLYNQFKLQPEGTYDLINASEYMLQKMAREGLLEKIDVETECEDYFTYAAPSITSKLKSMPVGKDESGTDLTLYEYAAGYMWGTLGIIYDPECSDTIEEDVKSWDIFWDEDYKDLISIKNSMRDTIVVGVMHAFKNLKNKENPNEDEIAFLKAVERAENDANDETEVVQNVFDLIIREDNYQSILEVIKQELISLKDNIFGFEVDSGKNDIITGKIKMNLAWSGDAIFSIDTALEEADKVLQYSVPEEGSNVWYDGWSIPVGGNRDLACKFIDFLSRPDNASRNMDYIGYTSFIACDEVFDLVSEWYGVSEYSEFTTYHGAYAYIDEDNYGKYAYVDESIVKYEDKFYRSIVLTDDTIKVEDDEDVLEYSKIVNDDDYEKVEFSEILPTDEEYWEEVDEDELGLVDPYDLTFIFENEDSNRDEYIIYPYEDSANELETQYPSEEILARCAVMKDFEGRNDDVVIMWGQIRAYTNMTPYYIILATVVGAALALGIYNVVKKQKSMRNRRKSIK
ncbi:MAG: extracellular solute-binding protein [Erysipelotrichales bacterium]|nr:extracellular solute-binding protein [Erysipelotrichales bacterium]